MSKFPNDRLLIPRKDKLSDETSEEYQARLTNLLAIQNWINRRPVSAAMASTAPFNLLVDNALTTVTGFTSLWDEYKLVDLTNSQIIIPETGMYLIEIKGFFNIAGPNAQWEASIQIIGSSGMVPGTFSDIRWVASGGFINPIVSGFFRANKPGTLTVKADRFTGAAGAPGDNTVFIDYVAIAKFSEIPSAVQ